VNSEQKSSEFEAVQLAVGDSYRKKSAGENLAFDLKTLSVLQYSDIRSLFVALISEV
jgi:hypothetical protein